MEFAPVLATIVAALIASSVTTVGVRLEVQSSSRLADQSFERQQRETAYLNALTDAQHLYAGCVSVEVGYMLDVSALDILSREEALGPLTSALSTDQVAVDVVGTLRAADLLRSLTTAATSFQLETVTLNKAFAGSTSVPPGAAAAGAAALRTYDDAVSAASAALQREVETEYSDDL